MALYLVTGGAVRVRAFRAYEALRAALTGRATSPGIFDVLVVLGRAESLGRIADQSGVAI